VVVVIGSIPMPTCNRFREKLDNNGKITTFTGVLLWGSVVSSLSGVRGGALVEIEFGGF